MFFALEACVMNEHMQKSPRTRACPSKFECWAHVLASFLLLCLLSNQCQCENSTGGEVIKMQTSNRYTVKNRLHSSAEKRTRQNHQSADDVTNIVTYTSSGKCRNCILRKLRVVVKYKADLGLINQIYSHTGAFLIALAIDAEVMLASARKRGSFGVYFTSTPWTDTPITRILDVTYITQYWARRGLIVHMVRYWLF